MPKRPGRKSAAQTPAPASERIYGSAKNPAKSASSEKSASKISLSSRIVKSLEGKLSEFKKTHDTKKVSLNDLKAVYRRGLGAYSSSHRPTITGGVPNSRNAWAMARVNKFLLKAGGTKVKAAYVQDDDLLKYDNGGETESEKDLIGIYKIQKTQQMNMENGGKIVSARITEMPEDLGDEMPKVYITFEDGTEEFLFDYYPDEISFTEKEFVGLTPDEARRLKFEKDKAYLMYSNTSAEFKNGGNTGGEDVVCVNCSWEWNTSQSDESDKYVCHKCKFDNTLFYTVFKDTMTVQEISEKHDWSVESIQNQLEEGIKHEQEEHTKGGTQLAREVAEIIALHHLEEMPDYYDRLAQIETVTDWNGLEDDGIIEVHEFEEPEVEYVRYSVWYLDPGETYDFYELSDAVDHIRDKNERGVIRDYEGRKVMGYDDIEKVLNGKASVKEYENGGGVAEEEPELKTQYEINEFLAQQKDEADAILFSRRTQIGKFMICNAYIDMAREKIERAENALEQNVWQQVMSIWEQTKDEVDDVIYMYEQGGTAGGCGCTRYLSKKQFAKGGLAYGNSHDKGGMPMEVKSTGQSIEIEGGEGVINKRSMQMTKKVEFEGKSMTPCEVISKINQMGGGVKFDCSDVKQIVEKDGEF